MNQIPEKQPEPKPSKSKSATLHWIQSHQGVGIGFASALLFVYVAPVVLILIAGLITDGFLEPHTLLSWFSTYLISSQATLETIHKILFPLVSAISVISFRDRPLRGIFIFAGAILLSWIGVLIIDVYCTMPNKISALKGLPNPIDTAMLGIFFSRVNESLIIYFAMLLGISISNNLPED
jgi:hypothetical protein